MRKLLAIPLFLLSIGLVEIANRLFVLAIWIGAGREAARRALDP